QPSGKNIIRWLLKKRTNGSVRYCQYTSLCLAHKQTEPFDEGFTLVYFEPSKNLIPKFLATQRINIHARFLFRHYW
ncbi:hypothetical protein, partial [Escherichia coli]